ncbi:MAG: Hpt domain-containing protein [Bacteroidetes bacterium]|nr:Hpt domain-containing protein [Bacteroidota bacterium]
MLDKEKFTDNMKYYDKEIVVQVIDMFLEQYPGRLKDLQSDILEMDFSKIDNHAHSLKGEVTYMSAEMAEVARKLEFKGKEKDGTGLNELLDALNEGIPILAKELTEFKKEYQS